MSKTAIEVTNVGAASPALKRDGEGTAGGGLTASPEPGTSVSAIAWEAGISGNRPLAAALRAPG